VGAFHTDDDPLDAEPDDRSRLALQYWARQRSEWISDNAFLAPGGKPALGESIISNECRA